MTDLVNNTLQNIYFLNRLIGHGGMADVYMAWDKNRATNVAVKVLHPELAKNKRFLNMFEKEAKSLREFRHDNIVQFYDFGNDGKNVFIVMQFVDGYDLRHIIIDRNQSLSLDETGWILSAVGKALHFAHKKKIYHCDVKSANILIRQSMFHEKDIFLTDFGVSRCANEMKGGGTPAYMAPELFDGAPVNERTDIYALGITLYEMLSGGKLPFAGNSKSPGTTSRQKIAWEQAHLPLPPLLQFNPGLPPAIVEVVEQALVKDPRQRYATIMEVLNDFGTAHKLVDSASESDQKTVLLSPSLPQPKEPVSPPPKLIPRVNQPHLLSVSGEKVGQVFLITRQDLAIGRSQSNQLRLLDSTISRSHATVLRMRSEFYIRDESSSLGTYLNGRRIPPGSQFLLNEGDRIGIGRLQVFEFRLR